MEISKQLPGKKIPNLRDLGGMIAADGKKIRQGRLIRSAQLYNATEKDLALLESLSVRKIFDFRNAQEAREKPDPSLSGCEYTNLSILESSSAVSWESNRTNQVSTEPEEKKSALKSGIEQMRMAYRDFIRKPTSREQYSRFLHGILETEDGAVLWHCTLGKDRCGWGSVLVEAVLGVSREDIMADYLYSNICLKPEIAGMIPILKKLLEKMHMVNAGTAVTEAREEYLEAAFDEAEKLYGSMDVFLEKGLGINEAMRDKLRDRYLI